MSWLKILFLRLPRQETSWLANFMWWEFRRIPFNILVGSFALFVSFLIQFFITGNQHPGSPLILGILMLGAILALNLYYTLFELAHVMSRNIQFHFVQKIRPWLFVIVLGSTFVGILMVHVAAFLFGIFVAEF